MDWRQFVMKLESIDPDRVERALSDLGAQSITLSDAGDNPVLEPAPGETPLWIDTKVTALFQGETDFAHLRRELCALLELEKLPDNHDETLRDRPWEREWLKDFQPMRFGRRLWVSPAGMEVDATDAVIVALDPGLAFGTGTHPTTSMCLTWLDQNELAGKKMLDLGCGSGILAIAALKLGIVSVDAIDIDLQAITATRQNAKRNGVSDGIRTGTTVHEINGPFDVVIANILAGTLIDMAADICKWLKPGGQLVLSGILSQQAENVASAYRNDIDFESPAFLEEWTRLSGMRH
jgi:ribosomal protein L11 methyltransferase